MNDVFNQQITIVKSDKNTYVPSVGAFCAAKLKEDSLIEKRWTYCRETFHRRRGKLDYLLFCHGKDRGEDLALFVRKVESKLKLKRCSLIGKTQKKSVIWLKVSSWWTIYSMRFSLFTIFLRAGQNYYSDKDNFEDAMFSIPYTSETKYAVNRFMEGNTRYTGNKAGWYNQFRWGGCHFVPCTPNEELVNQLLVKP